MLKWGWGTANRQFEFTITSYCLINKICRFIMSPFKYRLNQKPAVLCDWTDWLSSSTNDRRVLLHGCLAPLISKTTSSVFKWVEIICSFYSFFPSALQYIFVLGSLQWWCWPVLSISASLVLVYEHLILICDSSQLATISVAPLLKPLYERCSGLHHVS